MDGDIVFFYNPSSAPLAALVSYHWAQAVCGKRAKIGINKDAHPSLQLMKTKEKLSGNLTCARFYARLADSLSGSHYYGNDVLTATLIDHFCDLSQGGVSDGLLSHLNAHLSSRNYLATHSPSLADAVFWELVKGVDSAKLSAHANLQRWLQTVSADFQARLPAKLASAPLVSLAAADEKKVEKKAQQGGSFDIDLPDAVMGGVVTRFPPEPSGYLHIGHAKAALLNFTIANMYKGKMILRFDDTNPSKENIEFVENIENDLKTLGITWWKKTFTSDSFPIIMDYGTELIKKGLAYVDDTPVLQMREERLKKIPSKRRDAPIEENLRLWEEMKQGTELGFKCVVRGKLDMQSEVGCMRDPTFFRCNATPHHHTGTRYKVYPTYDFACPIVDSIEGVTHALRTIEYHDRNAQFDWVINALGLRKVHIWDFSKLAFKYSVMSKRKLTKFVEDKVVDGWSDPRFPTIQGIVRHGLTVPALREFIRLQGASKSNALMEWDKIWVINRETIDPEAHRYTAVAKKNAVRFVLRNVDAKAEETKQVPLHPKRAELGTKALAFTRTVLIEQADATEIKENEEVTLMTWGNAFARSITRDASGAVVEIQGDLHLAGNVKTTDKKLTWLPVVSSGSVPTVQVDFNHLITKEKIEEDEDIKDFIRKPSREETELLGEPALASVKAGQIIQLQRRGFFRCDRAFDGASPLVLFAIPDGRESKMSNLSSDVGKQMRDAKPAKDAPSAAKDKEKKGKEKK